MKEDEQRKMDEQYMRKALAEAQQAAAEQEIPIGAVVVCKGRILAQAHNLTETLCDVTAHAEMQAITAAANALGGKYLNECTLYVTVEPCPMCAGALGWAQIGRVVYGAADEKRGYSRYAPQVLHPKTEVIGGVLEDECRTLRLRCFETLSLYSTGCPTQPVGICIFSRAQMVGAMSEIVTCLFVCPGSMCHPVKINGTCVSYEFQAPWVVPC